MPLTLQTPNKVDHSQTPITHSYVLFSTRQPLSSFEGCKHVQGFISNEECLHKQVIDFLELESQ